MSGADRKGEKSDDRQIKIEQENHRDVIALFCIFYFCLYGKVYLETKNQKEYH